uniref:3-hydroxybutyryl-CoA dehydrogenase n=1 Tax=Alexandrium catenella TaxID=2925 RepID=A0A7S1QHB3_ALECA
MLPRLLRDAARSQLSCYARAHSSSAVKRIGVVGCGQMGTGIAIVAARHAQVEVLALDKYPASLEKSAQFVKDWTGKELKKGRLSEADVAAVTGRIAYGALDDAAAMGQVPGLDFVIEAVSEDINIKQASFKALLEAGLRSDSVLASNTSSISITRLGAVVERPERFIGMHFMNPVPVMPLVEVIRGLRTDDSTMTRTLELVVAMKKEHAVSEDRPGFVANRILMPYINEAVFALQDGIASAEDIDKTMRLGTNVPMGPLTLADFIGLDTCLSIMQVLHRDLGDSKYRPAPLLVNYVEAGWLGKKTKRGFYAY